MKINKTLLISMMLMMLIMASFLAGTHMTEQKYSSSRIQRCNTLISFAIDKVEKESLADQDTMEALISNIYAAYQFCDNPNLAGQLHDLWNALIFEENSYIGRENVLINQLKSISELLKTEA